MEVFVRNLPDQATEKQINNFFRNVLEKLGIKTYDCQKLTGRGLATITILDVGRAQNFLNLHGEKRSGPFGTHFVKQKLFLMGRPVNCSQSRKLPDKFLLETLKKEESDRYAKPQPRQPQTVPAKVQKHQRAFDMTKLKCGQWTYAGDDLVFATYFEELRDGRIIFGDRTVFMTLQASSQNKPSQQVEIPYESIQSMTIGPKSKPSITFSLSEAPKFFENFVGKSAQDSTTALALLLQSVELKHESQAYTRKRVTALSRAHETVVSSCLCYRLRLRHANDVDSMRALKRFREIPDSFSWNTSTVAKDSFVAQMTTLKSLLTGDIYSSLPFELKFQIQKLAQNGYLEPSKVVALLAVVDSQLAKDGEINSIVQSVQNLCRDLPYAGPDTEALQLSVQCISECLVDAQQAISEGRSYSTGLAERYDHIASIHKVMVTPTGTYLYGPEPEVKNRVLRKYSAFLDYFISVSFAEEDGQSLRFDRYTSREEIYYGRFQKVLNGVINIAGRGYEFLGFSHSSLRAQTCWFMAPFTLNGTSINARSVIKDLGDFRSFRSPAKCAARIGQAFSQTLTSVSIPQAAFRQIPDVERNRRTFSDGVGTCSREVLEEVWKSYSQARGGLKPTVLQIRFRGAKGVISLDNRLQGAALCLRPSMIKFEGTNATDIEICGAALRTLPMKLNRQMIKILEDLGVTDEPFLRLQRDEAEELRMTTLSAINAASFFERNRIGKVAKLPWLIRKLWAIGFSFTKDRFLRNTLEVAVLVQLRELKYKAHIRVKKGATVYGIMDETGYLQEGEVYCSVYKEEEGDSVIEGQIVVTRCPALHPGDIQCVTAVDVPSDNPMKALHHVVAFSSHGQRDLPSMLSGGDLDGDLYNIIYDHALYPKRLAEPADYPTVTPIDIGKPVDKSDMTEHFIKFMENDNLGLIATLHQILADRSPDGTFDPDCLVLASLHSTAVDFSKTGIPVAFKKVPRYPKHRPDFQAPGPRVEVEERVSFEDEEDTPIVDDDDEFEQMAKYGPQKHRFYESQKILGKLFRDIDEQKILGHVQAQSRSLVAGPTATDSLANVVWGYVCTKTALIQWRHCLDLAARVKESYESNLADTMMQYSSHPLHPLSEIEVFSGNILGKNGAPNKRQREFSKDMKEKHDGDVDYHVRWITRGEEESSGTEALERSIACLYVACHTESVRKRVGKLVSFVWIAAAVCLREVDKLPGADGLL